MGIEPDRATIPKHLPVIHALHIGHGLVYGGIERVLASVARYGSGLGDASHHFAFCFDGRAAREVRGAGADVSLLGDVRASRPWTVLRARARLQTRILANGINVVVMHGNWSHGLFGRCFDRNAIQLVAIAHAPYGSNDWTERRAAKAGADMVLANSEYTLASVRDIFPRASRQVWRCPIDDRANDSGLPREAIRQSTGGGTNDFIILMACRLDEYKGHDVLIRAVASFREQRTPGGGRIRTWIAGGAQTPAEVRRLATLQRRVRELGVEDRVHFLGQREDIADLMSAADVFCQPNVSPEPFGVVFVEALRAGLPVVTSAFGGAVEIVNERVGILIAPGDVAKMTDAIAELSGDISLRNRMSLAAREQGRNLCVPEVQMKQLGEILRSASPMTGGGMS